MRKKKNTRAMNRINEFLEMPKEIVSNEPKLTIIGFTELLIENYKGILEYEDFYIRINTYIGIININGFNLTLQQMNDENIMVCGKIESIDIETITDEEE